MSNKMKTSRACLASAAVLAVGLMATASLAQDVNLDPKLLDAAVAKAKALADGKNLSGSVEVIGQNGGYEGAITEAVMKPFETATGVKIKYTGTQDANIILARARAGNPPQVAMIQQGLMIGLAHDSKLVDLGSFMGDELKANFTPAVNDTASVDGKIYGVYQGFSPFMLWYNPKAYTGPKPGSSWDEVVKWTDDQAAKGTPCGVSPKRLAPAAGSRVLSSSKYYLPRNMVPTCCANGARGSWPGPRRR